METGKPHNDALPDSRATPDSGSDAPPEDLSLALSRMSEAQSMILEIFDDLLQSPQPAKDTAINRALATLGRFIGCDRTYVFRTRPPGRLDNTHEWVAAGITPMIDQLQDLDLASFKAFTGMLERGETVQVDDIDDLPDTSAERSLLEMQGVRSLILMPMGAVPGLRGFVGYDSVRRARQFLPGEIGILQSVTGAIDTLISEREANRRMARALADLASERARLAATLGAMPDLVVELGPDGRLLSHHSNHGPSVSEHLDQLIGKPLAEILPPETAAQAASLLAEVATSGQTRSLEIEFDLGGGPRWLQAHGAQRLDDAGALAGFVVVMRDVTVQRQQSQQLARLGAIARRTSNLVIVTDANDRIDWINEACQTRLGLSPTEVMGQPFHTLLQRFKAPADRRGAIMAALRSRQSLGCELRLTDTTGQPLWFELDLQPLPDEPGARPASMAVLVEITALKEAEARALSDRAAAMDASLDGIALIGPNGRFHYMNSALRDELDVTSDAQILGRNWRRIFGPSEIAMLEAQTVPVLSCARVWRGETLARTMTGRAVEMELSLTLRPDNGVIVIARNISERRRQLQDRERQREALQLAQRRAAIGHLAAGLAHDFNNLLATISGSLALIGQTSAPDAPHLPHVQRIASASDQAAALVQRLLGFGTPQAPRRAVIDLRIPLREVAALLAPGLGARRLHLDLPGTPAMAQADTTEVVQVVLNLAINARDALPKEKGDIHLRLTLADAAQGPFDRGALDPAVQHWRITVEDTGSGMDATTRAAVFDPYFSTKGEGGTGLGMVIIAAILNANQGAIRLHSTPGRGTRAEVFWPATHIDQETGHPAQSGTAKDLHGRAILMVDDSEALLTLHSAFLEPTGAEIATTSSPEDALEVLAEDPAAWDLVITDFDMPGLNGAEFAARVRKLAPDVPILLVTALPDWAARHPGAKAHFDTVLAKPVSGAELVSCVTALVRSKD